MYFVADLHALTTTPTPQELQTLIYDVAASWIALRFLKEYDLVWRTNK